MQDHAALGELLGQTIAALEVKDIERSYASLDLFWARLAMHIRAEHLHLFPAISDAVVETRNEDTPSPADVQSAIEELRHDHDFFMRELSQAVLTLRGLLANAGVAVVGTLEDIRKRIDAVDARLVKHNKIEEQGIYLWIGSLLSDGEQLTLAASVKKELENIPPRFGALPVNPDNFDNRVTSG